MADHRRSDVEILVHTSAPSRGQDDVKYRALAQACVDFRPLKRWDLDEMLASVDEEVFEEEEAFEEASGQLQHELLSFTQDSGASYLPPDEDNTGGQQYSVEAGISRLSTLHSQEGDDLGHWETDEPISVKSTPPCGQGDLQTSSSLRRSERQRKQTESDGKVPVLPSGQGEPAASFDKSIAVKPRESRRHNLSFRIDSALSFQSVDDNLDSPRFSGFGSVPGRVAGTSLADALSSQILGSTASWQAPASQIPDSQSDVQRPIPAFSSPGTILDVYLQNLDSSSGSTGSVSHNSQSSSGDFLIPRTEARTRSQAAKSLAASRKVQESSGLVPRTDSSQLKQAAEHMPASSLSPTSRKQDDCGDAHGAATRLLDLEDQAVSLTSEASFEAQRTKSRSVTGGTRMPQSVPREGTSTTTNPDASMEAKPSDDVLVRATESSRTRKLAAEDTTSSEGYPSSPPVRILETPYPVVNRSKPEFPPPQSHIPATKRKRDEMAADPVSSQQRPSSSPSLPPILATNSVRRQCTEMAIKDSKSTPVVTPRRSSRMTSSQVSSPVPGLSNEILESTEIRAPLPATSDKDYTEASMVPGYLRRWFDKMPQDLLRPIFVARELRPTERGHWLVDTAAWNNDLRHRFWNFIGTAIQRGKVGWGVWCARENGFARIRVYCWGHTASYIFLFLVAASERKIVGIETSWMGGNGEPLVTMK